MSPSYRRINYSLRPAKYAERRMLAEVFRRLHSFAPIEEYTYVGFGSVWYADFILFHRLLGIKSMISIEREAEDATRFEENKPFSIDIKFGSASLVLPDLDWSTRQFVWLDYDDPISTEILRDVRTVATHARSGTVIVVSLPCVEASQIQETKDANDGVSAASRFTSEFGAARTPSDLPDSDLKGWNFGDLSLNIVADEVRDGLVARNSYGHVLYNFEPICRFRYSDGAKIATSVGIIFEEGETNAYTGCHFDLLDFIDDPNTPVRIDVPLLTVRELRELERQLPRTPVAAIQFGSIPESEAKRFIRLHRYFPNYAVIDH